MANHKFPQSELTERVIGAAYEVHNELGFGFLEAVYQNSLAIALREIGINVAAEQPIKVYFRGHEVGYYVVDLLAAGSVVIELKSVRQLSTTHEVQLVNYLKATGLDVGLLLNFGPDGVEVRRKSRVYKKP